MTNIIEFASDVAMAALSKLKGLKNHPRVFIFGGCAVAGVGTVAACAQTYKHVDRIVDTTKQKLEEAQTGKEKAAAYGYAAKEFGKAFVGPVALTAAGYGMVAYGNHIHEVKEEKLTEDLMTAVSAWAALKNRMEDELGKEKSDEIRYGVDEIETTEMYEDGTAKTEKTKEIDKNTALNASLFSRFFDKTTSRCASNCGDPLADYEYNVSYVKGVLRACQNLLDTGLSDQITMAFVCDKLDLTTQGIDLPAGWLPGDKIEITIHSAKEWACRDRERYLKDCLLLDFNCRPDIRGLLPGPTEISEIDKK